MSLEDEMDGSSSVPPRETKGKKIKKAIKGHHPMAIINDWTIFAFQYYYLDNCAILTWLCYISLGKPSGRGDVLVVETEVCAYHGFMHYASKFSHYNLGAM